MLKNLVGLRNAVTEMQKQLDSMATQIDESRQDSEGNLQLPDGLQLPLSSDDDVSAMEAALDDGKFRQRQVYFPAY